MVLTEMAKISRRDYKIFSFSNNCATHLCLQIYSCSIFMPDSKHFSSMFKLFMYALDYLHLHDVCAVRVAQYYWY